MKTIRTANIDRDYRDDIDSYDLWLKGIHGDSYITITSEEVNAIWDEDEDCTFDSIEQHARDGFASGMTDERIRLLDADLFKPLAMDFMLRILDALRKAGGIWIDYDMALLEGRGLVDATSDPELRPLWLAIHANDEIIDD